MVSISHHIPGA